MAVHAPGSTAVSRFGALRAGYGTLLLAVPDPVIRLYTGHRPDPLTRAVTRVLGARHLIQGILTSGAPGTAVLALGAKIDLAHAASMLALATLSRRRRAGLVDAAIAGVFAVTGTVLVGRTGHITLGRLAAGSASVGGTRTRPVAGRVLGVPVEYHGVQHAQGVPGDLVGHRRPTWDDQG